MGALPFCKRSERVGNYSQYPNAVLENVVVPKAKDAPSLLTQNGVSYGMIAGTIMVPAVSFDDETCFNTGEINDIGRDRVLPSKAPAKLIMAQLFPEQLFCFCSISAQPARVPDDRMTASHLCKLA